MGTEIPDLPRFPCRRVGLRIPPARRRRRPCPRGRACRTSHPPLARWLSLGPASRHPRRRSGHAPSLGRRGPRRRMDDTRRPSALRSRRARARSSRPRRHGRRGRWPASAPRPERLARAYRRALRRAASSPATRPDDAEREAYRDDGRRLIEALVAYLDADAGDRASATGPKPGDGRIVDEQARRLAASGTSLTEAVARFVAARRPFLAELAGIGRRRSLDPSRLAVLYGERRRCSIDCCCRSSRRTRRGRRPMRLGRRSCPRADLAPRPGLRGRPVRPVARAARRVPAHLGLGMLFYGIAAGAEALAAAGGWNEAPVPDLVPDRRGLDGRLARARDGVPARPDALRLHVRAVPVPGRRCSPSSPQPARVRGGRHAAAPVLHRGRGAGPGRGGRDVLPERALAAARRRRPSSGRRVLASS